MTASPLAVARACLQAYVDKNRAAIEALIADDYRFTSPIDNSLDRKTYFEVCWPNSKTMTGFDYIYQFGDANHAFIVYEGRTDSGKKFRNSEVHTVRNGQLVATRSISAGTSHTKCRRVSTSRKSPSRLAPKNVLVASRDR
jgi:hypothetical protein